MAEQLLPSLAILKVNFDSGSDYIENFVPFVAECLRTSPTDQVAAPELQAAVRQTFGLVIPQHALKTILRRAAKHGYVRLENNIYLRNADALDGLAIAKTKADVLRRYEALVHKLQAFAKDSYSQDWTAEEVEGAFLTYLHDREAQLLSSAITGQQITVSTVAVPHADFIVNAFIAQLYMNDPEGFAFLETIVKGSMLANVLWFPDLSRVARRFKRLAIYFDTPFLLRALGYIGEQMQAPCRELLDLLYTDNAQLRCFDHTFEELRGVLEWHARMLRSPWRPEAANSDMLSYLIDSGLSASDLALAIARLPESLRSLHVSIEERPPYSAPLGIDEESLRKCIEDHVRYRRPDGIQHEIDAISAIHRLRRGRFTCDLEDCAAIFITTNLGVVQAAGQFFRAEYSDAHNTMPHCISDTLLTTITWIKQPLGAPDLPRKQIIANCYAAMNPSEALWRRYLMEMEKLRERGDITEQDCQVLRYATEARRALMDLTLGEPEVFVEGTIQEVLAHARAAIQAETRATLRLERRQRRRIERRATDADKARQAAEQRLAHAEAQAVAAAEAERLAAAQRIAEIQAQTEAAARQRHERLVAKSRRLAYYISRVALWASTPLVVLAIYLTLPKPFSDWKPNWVDYVAPGIILLFWIFGALNMVFGTHVIGLVRRWELWIAERIERLLTGLTE